ncbi:MAG: alpha/beta fold hydrolase [Alphaproteobacteria bacterium]
MTKAETKTPNIHEFYVKVNANIKLRAGYCKSDEAQQSKDAKGTIILLTGRTEFIEKYHEIIGILTEKGYDLLIFDWRGQGKSTRLVSNGTGHIDDFSAYVEDLTCVLDHAKTHFSISPTIILTHSMGGQVALHYPKLSQQFEKIIMVAPMLSLLLSLHKQKRIRWALLWLLKPALKLSWFRTLGVIPKAEYERNEKEFLNNALTDCQDRFYRTKAFIEKDPALYVGSPTLGWLYAAMRAMNGIMSQTRSEIPSLAKLKQDQWLIIQAKNDRIVDANAATSWLETLDIRPKTVWLDAKHEPLMSPQPIITQTITEISEFIGQGKK